MRHIADDCLSALVHRDVLDPDGLIASAPVSFERLYLRRERPAELVESAFRAVLLRDIFDIGEPTRECHGRCVNSSHLRRKHGFYLVFWLRAFHHGQHEIELTLVHFSASCPSIGQLTDQSNNKGDVCGRERLREET
jgi:hypothetical protein